MSQTTTATNAVVLTSASLWHNWISIIKSNARQSQIWDLIDPSKEIEPTLTIPTTPLKSAIAGDDEKLRSDQYTDLVLQFNIDHRSYREKREALIRTLGAIQKSISQEYLTYIIDKDSPWQALKTLQRAIEPHSSVRTMEIGRQYKTLCSGPPRGKNIKQWLNEWEKLYEEAKAIGHFDVYSGVMVNEFIESLRSTAPQWASSAAYDIQSKRYRDEKEPTFTEVLNMFRQTPANNSLFASSSAFAATLQGQTPGSSNPTSRTPRSDSPSAPTRECICGKMHWYSDCYYLMEFRRPKGWKPNSEILKKMEEAMKNTKFKEKVENTRQRQKAYLERGRTSTPAPSASELPSGPQPPGLFATTWHSSDAAVSIDTIASINTIPSSYSVDKAVNYDIINSYILDSGSNIHVCNDPNRFKITHTTTHQDYLVSGSTTYQIEAYGTVDITLNTPTGHKTNITLQHVALVTGFFTNLVSFARAKQANILWDTGKDTLYMESEDGLRNHFCSLMPHNGHWIVEYNAPSTDLTIYKSSAASTTISPSKRIQVAEQAFTEPASGAVTRPKIFEISPTHLHQIMGHAGADAIAKLPSAVQDLKLTSPCSSDEFTSCEACRLSKAHQIISRSSDSEVPSTRPLQRVAYDLIPMEQGYNDHKWISHFVCESTGYHWVWTHRHKHEATKIVAKMVDLAEKHYKQPISFLRTDGEKALGQAFEDILSEHGIISERTAPYTPAQNGKTERSGGVITTKGRCMRISANLPHDLWPETISAAAYILNRTPVFKTGLTPFEALYGIKPRLYHMKTYGCRAYPLIYKIPKLQKLEPRAHIGYLVGYSSRNIYRIWIPSKKQVIRIRDVTFDQTTHYQLHDVDAAQLVSEQELYDAIQILQEIPESLLAHNQDEQELEIPATSETNIDQPTTDKQVDEVIPDQDQLYLSPPLTVTEDTAGSPSPAPLDEPSAANTGEDIGESVGETGGERPWEYRIVGAPAPRSSTISANLDDNNVISNRTRNRQQAHAVAIQNLNQQAGYHAAFATNPVPKLQLHRDKLPEEPRNWKQMLKHPHSQQFIQAANKEFEHLQKRGTFKLVTRPIQKDVLPLVWVFKYKFDDAGHLIKHKARLCVRGDLQKTDQDTAAATLAIRVFRALMSITASFKLKAKQYDAVNAFINSTMNEELFVDYPEGMKIPINFKNPCFLLLRALYGLKQSPLLWLQEVSSTLLDLGVDSVPGVDCLFTNQWLILFFYVDDFVLLYRAEDEQRFLEFESALLASYEIRSLGNLSWFLGIRIIRSDDKLYLCQDSYIDKIAEKYCATTTNPHPKTPLSQDPLIDYDGQATTPQIYAYQQRIGSLTFAATTTRPDISFSTAKLAQFLTNPSPIHLAAANRLLSYLHNTKRLAIEFSESKTNPIFLSSSDAAFADDQKTRKSSFGYLIQLYGGPIDWKASKQATVTTSSTEAELLALSETARQTLWWKRFFENIYFDTKQPMDIYCDNTQTLSLIQNETPRLSTRLRHVDVHSCWLRQEVQAKRITAAWIPTAKMPADGLTKALPNQKHQTFLNLLNMVDISDLIIS